MSSGGLTVLGDPPEPGHCKLRVRSEGELTRVLAVMHDGTEVEVDWASAVEVRAEAGHATKVQLEVIGVEVQSDGSMPVQIVSPSGREMAALARLVLVALGEREVKPIAQHYADLELVNRLGERR